MAYSVSNHGVPAAAAARPKETYETGEISRRILRGAAPTKGTRYALPDQLSGCSADLYRAGLMPTGTIPTNIAGAGPEPVGTPTISPKGRDAQRWRSTMGQRRRHRPPRSAHPAPSPSTPADGDPRAPLPGDRRGAPSTPDHPG
ncbi:hypothetical protein FRAAL2128 [Frankia alni ACN14a]|uniref:Uncharacterized protein n=1 Tax=Frankia alni (strain DSM 45986 / CECT 9034 / ACN14a) TaxID=326424 RepID=Q0RNV9_FRAAA|nr:hypothetical protein FRAAL2128 [Frankia alni ACN14a]